jgi:hypothetical protein
MSDRAVLKSQCFTDLKLDFEFIQQACGTGIHLDELRLQVPGVPIPFRIKQMLIAKGGASGKRREELQGGRSSANHQRSNRFKFRQFVHGEPNQVLTAWPRRGEPEA